MEIKSYKKKNGETAYSFKFYLGKKNGVSQYAVRKGFSTKAQARAALLQLQVDLDNDEENKKDITVREVSEMWLKEYADTVQDSTYIKTYRNFKNHIYPVFGEQKIASITPIQLQEQINEWSRKLVYGRNMFRLLAFTGARKGEILALKWTDWIDNTLDINKAITRGFDGESVGATKNKSSVRLVSLDKKTIDLLSEYRKMNPTTTFIFESPEGKPIPSSLPRKWLLQIVKGTDVKPIKIHGFRHTHASLCFEAGMTLKQVQHRLGHSDLKTTMNIYTHITKKAKDDIGEKFANYIDF